MSFSTRVQLKSLISHQFNFEGWNREKISVNLENLPKKKDSNKKNKNQNLIGKKPEGWNYKQKVI